MGNPIYQAKGILGSEQVNRLLQEGLTIITENRLKELEDLEMAYLKREEVNKKLLEMEIEQETIDSSELAVKELVSALFSEETSSSKLILSDPIGA